MDKPKRKLLNYCLTCCSRTEHIKLKSYSNGVGIYLGTEWKCKTCGSINKSFRK
jgi:hypothetical protein